MEKQTTPDQDALILRAIASIADCNTQALRIVAHMQTAESTPRKGPTRAGRVIEMKRVAGA